MFLLWPLDMPVIFLLVLVRFTKRSRQPQHQLTEILSDDGSLRVYDLSSYKVLKAVRGLGAEVSSIVCVKRPGSELRDAWIAHGKMVSINLLSRFFILKYLYRYPNFNWPQRK